MTHQLPPPTEDSPPTAGDIHAYGDIHGQYVLIGHGAQMIIHQALSAAEEAERQHQVESHLLAEAVADYARRLRAQLPLGEPPPQPPKGGSQEIPPTGGLGRPIPTGGVEGLSEPYKSLLPYRLGDAPLFFGRAQATTDLLRTLDGHRGQLTVLHAESGAGKTSLLQAGLAAQLLQRGHLPLYVRPWRDAPSLAIKRTLLPDLERVPALAGLALRPFLKRTTALLGLSTVIYILLDQFEEFFIRLPDEAARHTFIDELGQCLEDETLRVRFVLAVRKDHFASLSDFRERIPTIFSNEYPLKLFSRAEAAAAITAPAALAGLHYGPGVVERLLTELPATPNGAIMPAQLQLVCWALYRTLSQEQRLITPDRLNHMGGVAGILRNYLHRVLTQEIPAHQRVQAQRVLEALVRSDRSRDIRTAAQLSHEINPPAQVSSVLEALVGSRLLRVVEPHANAAVSYELAHDVLIEQIELDPDLLARKAAQELLDQEVDAWQRNPSLRIGEEKLKLIEAQARRIHFSDEAQTLYTLSRKKRRNRRRLLFGLLGGVLIALCVTMLLYQSLVTVQQNYAEANNALVTATSVIRVAENEAAQAERRQATAEAAAEVATEAEATALAAEATAAVARQTAEVGRQAAVVAEQTAVAAGQAARTRQAEAEQNAVVAADRAATAQVAQQQAVIAQATAQAEQATAQAGQQAAVVAEQTAVAQRATAVAAAEQARRAQAEAEAAQRAAERARDAAEAQAEAAAAAAQEALATQMTAVAIRDQALLEAAEARRQAAIIEETTTCPVGENPGAVAFDGTHIWVTNKFDKTVTKLQAGTCQVAATIDTEAGPSDVVAGGGYIWVTNKISNTLQKIDPITGVTLNIFEAGPTGSRPSSLLYGADALWVANEGSDTVRKFNPHSGAVLWTQPVGQTPRDLVWDGTSLWVANFGSNTLSRLEGMTGNLIAEIPVGSRPVWLAYDGTHIWVANRAGHAITKLLAAEGEILATFPVGDPSPDALAFDGTDLWVVTMDRHTLLRLHAVEGATLSSLPTGTTPTAMLFDGGNIWVVAEDDGVVQRIPTHINLTGAEPTALAGDDFYLWVANRDDNTVSKLLASTGQPVATYSVGQRPAAVTIANDSVWVANREDNTVSHLRGTDGAKLGTFSVEAGPVALAEAGGYIWVVNEGSGTVTRLQATDGGNLGSTPVGSQPVDIVSSDDFMWVANKDSHSLSRLDLDGTHVADYPLGIAPRALVYADNALWVAYIVNDPPNPAETRVRQIDPVDGTTINDLATGIEAEALPAPDIVHDGTYVWISIANTTQGHAVVRLNPAAPEAVTPFHVCESPSALLSTDGVWVACQEDNIIQKLPASPAPAVYQTSPPAPSAAAFRQYLPLVSK